MTATFPLTEQESRLRARIAHYQAACGCELGAALTFAAALAFAVHWLAADPGWSTAGTLGRGAAWVLASALVGKLLGLAYARLRLVQVRAELRSLATDGSPAPPWVGG